MDEAAKKKITDLEALVASLKAEVAKAKTDAETASGKSETVRAEAARYRVARNKALKERHALKAVLKAHNITFALEDQEFSTLSIEDGKVSGDFAYEAPDPNKATPKTPPGGPTGALTVDAIRQMSAEEINARWDDVQTVMAASA